MSEDRTLDRALAIEAAGKVAAALRRDAVSQESARFAEIGESYDDVLTATLPLTNDADHTISAAFTFWDWWVDARNHEWRYYDGIQRDDWPRLARHVADTLERGESISDPILTEMFIRSARPSIVRRLWNAVRNMFPR